MERRSVPFWPRRQPQRAVPRERPGRVTPRLPVRTKNPPRASRSDRFRPVLPSIEEFRDVSNANANQNDNLTIGKFKLVNCLASGQHSQVWEATDSETTRRVALKLLLPQALKEPEQV